MPHEPRAACAHIEINKMIVRCKSLARFSPHLNMTMPPTLGESSRPGRSPPTSSSPSLSAPPPSSKFSKVPSNFFTSPLRHESQQTGRGHVHDTSIGTRQGQHSLLFSHLSWVSSFSLSSTSFFLRAGLCTRLRYCWNSLKSRRGL